MIGRHKQNTVLCSSTYFAIRKIKPSNAGAAECVCVEIRMLKEMVGMPIVALLVTNISFNIGLFLQFDGFEGNIRI